MALTPEQQAQVDIQLAIENARHANQMALEKARNDSAVAAIQAQAAAQASAQSAANDAAVKQIKLEAVRLAKETLIENARSKPVDARDVSAADITAFAAALEAHING